MAFCLFKLKNSLVKKASLAICSTRLSTSHCFACHFESVNGHYIALTRTSSTAVHYKFFNDQFCPADDVIKQNPQSCSAVGVRDSQSSTIGVGLAELLYHDPLAILLNSRLQVFENASAMSRLLPEDTAGTKAEPKECLKHQRYSLQPAVRLSHSPCNADHHHQFQDFFPLSTISCNSSTIPVAINEFSSACVGSRVLGNTSAVMLASPSPKPQDECSPAKASDGDDPYGYPSEDKLQRVHDVLVKSLSEFFSKPLDYRIYDKNIIFENRFRGTVTKGLSMYAMQMMLLNTVGHLKHAAIKLDIIKTTVHPQEGTIKVRWRIKGMKPTKALHSFWARKWRLTEIQRTDSSNWYDGFSTFYVNSSGLVFKHVADNMMPDDDRLGIPTKAGIFAKIAVMFGLMPRPAAGHSSVMQEFPPLV